MIANTSPQKVIAKEFLQKLSDIGFLTDMDLNLMDSSISKSAEEKVINLLNEANSELIEDNL